MQVCVCVCVCMCVYVCVFAVSNTGDNNAGDSGGERGERGADVASFERMPCREHLSTISSKKNNVCRLLTKTEAESYKSI